MSKKHFIKLADIVREHNRLYPDDQFSENQLESLGDFCRSMNGSFMRDRWLGYIAGECGSSGGAIRKAS